MTLEGSVGYWGNPQGWPEIKLRALVSQRKEVGAVGLPLLGVSLAHGVHVRAADDGRQAASVDLSGYRVVQPGDIVMNALGKPHGSIGMASEAGITSPAYWVLAPSGIADPRFMHHLLRSEHLINEYKRLGKNLPPNQFDLSWALFRSIAIPTPALDVQRQVAVFLDGEVSRIDEAVQLRRRQVEALQEQTQSYLSEQYDGLVTAFGSVRLRYLGVQARQGWSPQCDDRLPDPGEWGVLKAGAVNHGRFRPYEVKALPHGVAPRHEFVVRAGDLLVNRASGSLDLIGSAAIVLEPLPRTLLCDKIYRLSAPTSVLHPLCLVHLWRSKQIREHLRLGASGADGMANSLPSSVIRDVPLPRMALSDQHKWAAAAQERFDSVEGANSEMTAQITLLEERKRSLITAAVTGEFDVTTASGRGV